MAAPIAESPASRASDDNKISVTHEVAHHDNVKHDAVPSADRLADAIASDKLDPWSKPLLKLYVYAVIAFLCSTMNGSSLPLRSISSFFQHSSTNR